MVKEAELMKINKINDVFSTNTPVVVLVGFDVQDRGSTRDKNEVKT